MDKASDRDPYFFWTSRTVVPVVIGIHLVGRFCNFKDLSVADVGPASNAEKNENRCENPSESQPFVQTMAHEKAKNNTASHSKAQLHDNGQVFCPVPVFLVVEQTAFPCRFIVLVSIRRESSIRAAACMNLRESQRSQR